MALSIATADRDHDGFVNRSYGGHHVVLLRERPCRWARLRQGYAGLQLPVKPWGERLGERCPALQRERTHLCHFWLEAGKVPPHLWIIGITTWDEPGWTSSSDSFMG